MNHFLRSESVPGSQITQRPSPGDAPDVYADLVANPGHYMGIVFDWNNF